MSKKEYILTQIIDATKNEIQVMSKFFIAGKVLFVLSLYTFLIVNSLENIVAPAHVPECIKDEMQELTLPINEFLDKNHIYRNALIIISSLMIDITAFVSTMRFIIYEKNWKLVLTLLSMYIFRGLLQSMFFLRFPTNYIWGNPGLFSVTVPYAPANDFFFSGHVGLSTICFIYYRRNNVKIMKQLSFVTIFVEFFTLLVTRAHYSIDLVAGIIIGHYIYLVWDWIYAYLDERKARLKVKNGTSDSSNLASPAKYDDKKLLLNGKVCNTVSTAE